MQNAENLSTPTRNNRDLVFPSSPESIFSSPNIYGMNTWTPGRATLWPVGISGSEAPESSPSHRFSAFQTPKSIDLTPNANQDFGDGSAQKGDNCKRGRPRADVINHLIHEGSSSPSGIKCKVCNRVFPREKSLQAHLRTHTGERPYICDYPGCSRAFTQSGQLKTHQRLHAGEKPFVCSSPGCGNRYTHANRTCPLHPYHKPQRSSELVLQPTLAAGEDPAEVARWLENYRRERIDKTPAKTSSSIYAESSNSPPPTGLTTTTTPVASTSLPRIDILLTSPFGTVQSVAASDVTLATTSDVTLSSKRFRSKRGLASELEQENVTTPTKIPHLFPRSPMGRSNIIPPNLTQIPAPLLPRSPIKNCLNLIPTSPRRPALGDITPGGNELSPSKMTSSPGRRLILRQTPPASPIKTLNLKKRWLKEVVQEQRRHDLTQQPSDQQQLRQHQQHQQQQLQQPIAEEEPDSENLASPIRWNDASDAESTLAALRYRRSPIAWSAVSALVEMAEREQTSFLNNQPLNLSKSKENSKC